MDIRAPKKSGVSQPTALAERAFVNGLLDGVEDALWQRERRGALAHAHLTERLTTLLAHLQMRGWAGVSSHPAEVEERLDAVHHDRDRVVKRLERLTWDLRSAPPSSGLMGRLRGAVQALRACEQAEIDILTDAYWTDVGVGD